MREISKSEEMHTSAQIGHNISPLRIAVPLTSKMERKKSEPKKSDNDDDDDVRVALLRQLGIAEDDLKLLLAADAVKVNDGGSDGGGGGVCGLGPFRAFCRKVIKCKQSRLSTHFEFQSHEG